MNSDNEWFQRKIGRILAHECKWVSKVLKRTNKLWPFWTSFAQKILSKYYLIMHPKYRSNFCAKFNFGKIGIRNFDIASKFLPFIRIIFGQKVPKNALVLHQAQLKEEKRSCLLVNRLVTSNNICGVVNQRDGWRFYPWGLHTQGPHRHGFDGFGRTHQFWEKVSQTYQLIKHSQFDTKLH